MMIATTEPSAERPNTIHTGLNDTASLLLLRSALQRGAGPRADSRAAGQLFWPRAADLKNRHNQPIQPQDTGFAVTCLYRTEHLGARRHRCHERPWCVPNGTAHPLRSGYSQAE